MSDQYVTEPEIVAATGKTKQAINKRANKGLKNRKSVQTEQPWAVHHIEVIGQATVKFYDRATLPKDIQAALDKKGQRDASAHEHNIVKKVRADIAAEKVAKQAKGEQNLKKLMEALSPAVQARFDGRYEVVKGWEQFFNQTCPPRNGKQKGKKESYRLYAEAFNAGETIISTAIREQFAPVSTASIQRWVLKFEKEGMTSLIDHWDGKARKDVNVFTKQPALEKAAIALLIARPKISGVDMTTVLAEAAKDQDTGEILFEAPSYCATNRFCNAWKKKNAELYTAATNPDEWKNKYMVAFGNASEDVVRLNQRWEMDATPADWMLQDEDGGLRRHSVSVVIDVYSRRSLMVVSPTPRAETHKLALRLAIMLWGVPEEVVTDNGKDYVSKAFLATLDMLDITHHRTDPFSPWQKPFVERMNQTMLHSVLEVYSSFIGHNVAERSAIEARTSFAERLFSKETDVVEMAMPAHLLQTRINQWLSGIYEQEVHGSLSMSPFAKAASYRGEVRRIDDERALDVLLAPPAGKGSYTVVKKGINILGAQFIALELSLIVGKKVNVYLTDDYGQIVVYHDGKFVCVARCPERTGISRQEIASHARQLQRKNIAEQRKAAKMPKLDPDALVSSFLKDKAEAAGKLVSLPAPAKVHMTTALTAASQAARTLDGAVPTSDVPDALQMIMNKRQADRATPAAPEMPEPQKITVIPETPQLRFRKWLELDELLTHGGTIDDSKLTRWYGTYPQTAEHASMYKRHQVSLVASDTDTASTVVREFKTQN